MAAQKGKDLLLKIDSDGQGTFMTVAGLRSRTIAFNAETVDVTDQESSGQWRELLVGAGIKTARISGGGIFKDQASDELVRATFFCRHIAQLADHDPGLRHDFRPLRDHGFRTVGPSRWRDRF